MDKEERHVAHSNSNSPHFLKLPKVNIVDSGKLSFCTCDIKQVRGGLPSHRQCPVPQLVDFDLGYYYQTLNTKPPRFSLPLWSCCKPLILDSALAQIATQAWPLQAACSASLLLPISKKHVVTNCHVSGCAASSSLQCLFVASHLNEVLTLLYPPER